MAQLHTHYDNLKVARNAPPEVIRAAYKTLSQKYHPDRNPNSAEAIRIIQIINVAYEVLSDPVRRQEHDDWIVRMESGDRRAADRPGAARAADPAPQRPSRRSHRRSRFSVQRFRHKTSARMSRLLHKARSMLDRFSRRLLSKSQ